MKAEHHQIMISVIIPIFKVEKYIESCARSLFDQSLKENVEFIFVDDASPDGSIDILKKIIEEYPSRKNQIKIIHHKNNKGLAMARLTGIKNAIGDYVFHVDSDDYLDLNALKNFYKVIKHDNEIDVVLANHISAYPDTQVKINLARIVNPNRIAKEMIMRLYPCNIWNKLIKKSLYTDLQIPIINNGEDYVTMPRILSKSKKISFIDNYTYYYTHLNPESFQFSMHNSQNLLDFKKSIEFLENYYNNYQDMIYSLKIGKLKYYAILIFYSDNKTIKNIIVPKELQSYFYKKEMGNMRLPLFLYRYHLYSWIQILNRFYRRLRK